MSDTDKDYKDVHIGTEVHHIDHGKHLGHSSYPNKPYPGYSVDYPTCSEPGRENKGCDAWKMCTTRGAGPYAVAFINPAGNQSSCHCRNWMRSLRFKPDYEVIPGTEIYEPFVERIAVDPTDRTKGYKLKTGKMKVHNVKNPVELGRAMNPQRKQRRQEQQEVYDEQFSETIETDELTRALTDGDTGTHDQGDAAGRERPVGSYGNRKGRGRPKGRAQGAVGDMPGSE